MKRFIIFTCIIAIALSILGCGKEESEQLTKAAPYELKEENGKFYILFLEEYLESKKTGNVTSGASTQIAADSARIFSSVTELKNDLETGNLSETILASLSRKAKNGVLEIPDPDKICDVVLPTGLDVVSVFWNITSYEIQLSWDSNKNTEWTFITVDLEGDLYDTQFNKYIVNYADAASVVISDRTIEDRNAREFIYTNNSGKYKQFLYQIESDGRTLYIQEMYRLESNYDRFVSETVPENVQILCKEDGVSWFTYFNGFEERPSIEWLTSFGVKSLAN